GARRAREGVALQRHRERANRRRDHAGDLLRATDRADGVRSGRRAAELLSCRRRDEPRGLAERAGAARRVAPRVVRRRQGRDPRVAKLADLLVNYSVGLKPGQLVRIDAATVAAPLVTEVYRHALRAGAHPRTRIEIEGLDVIAVGEASDEQLSFVSELDRFEVEQLAAIMTIWGDRNTRALTQADPARISRRIASRRELNRRFRERLDA